MDRPDAGRMMPKHIRALDGVRGIAILMVLLVHFYRRELFHDHVLLNMVTGRLAGAGNYGVELFFVLSGFLITGILLDYRHEPASLVKFYARRSLRIFPLYYAALAVLFMVLPQFAEFDTPAVEMSRLQGWLWTYMMDWPGLDWIWDSSKLFWIGHFWSLCVEEHFYLCWPAIIYLVPARRLWIACIAMLGIGMLSRCSVLLFSDSAPEILNWLTLRKIDGLAIGSLIAIAIRNPDYRQFLPKGVWLRRGYLIAGGLSCLYIFLPNDFEFRILSVINELVVVLLFGLLVIHVVHAAPQGSVSRILSTPFLVAMGKYSYGLYVIHGVLRPQLLRLIELPGGKPTLLMAFTYQAAYYLIAGGASFAVAFASYHLLEKQFLGLKRFFEYAGSRRPVSKVEAVKV